MAKQKGKPGVPTLKGKQNEFKPTSPDREEEKIQTSRSNGDEEQKHDNSALLNRGDRL